jgi:nickel-type superoxide dismutase maturation protease
MNKTSERRANKPLMLRRVKGDGMYPTLEKGQLVLIRRRPNLKINDIVVFVHNGAEKVKRICGMEGDFFYVLGDNPRYSTDSRQYGYIRRDSVVGTVVFPREDGWT